MAGLVLILLSILFPRVTASASSTTVMLRGSNTLTIGTWELPWPLQDYKIDIYVTPSYEGSNIISWSMDRNLISPGEKLSMTINLNKGKYNYRIDFRVIVIRKSAGDIIVDKTVGIDLGSIDVPGSWSSPSLAVPVIPLEVFGVPAELSIYFQFSFSTYYSIILDTYGLDPQTKTLEFSADASKTVSFSKSSGVGAEIRMKSVFVKTEGELTVSAGLSLSGFPTPFKIDFATIPIVDWVTGSILNIDMALLKTPVSISFSLSSTLVNLGDPITISGRITPASGSIPVQLVIEGAVIDATETCEDGSFSFIWKPSHSGAFSIFVKSLETQYTTSSTSSSLQLLVNKPPEASFTFFPISPYAGDEVEFTDESVDFDGNIVSWFWEFGDGSISTEQNPSHKFKAGTYTVRLTVTDDKGAKDTKTMTITIKKIPTTLTIEVSETEIMKGDSITFSGSISPAVEGATVTLTYTKPDGSTFTRTVTTDADGAYSDSFTPTEEGAWSVEASWEGDAQHEGASSSSVSFTVRAKRCIIATATYGSELSPEVQFLRGFRDNMILNTFAGRCFMTVFNAWYYSWSPAVASVIASHELLRNIMKILLYPLIGVLHLSTITFSLLSFNTEFAIVTSGLVASSIIGIVYFTPAFLMLCIARNIRISSKMLKASSTILTISLGCILIAEITKRTAIMMFSTPILVLSMMSLAILSSVSYLKRLTPA